MEKIKIKETPYNPPADHLVELEVTNMGDLSVQIAFSKTRFYGQVFALHGVGSFEMSRAIQPGETLTQKDVWAGTVYVTK